MSLLYPFKFKDIFKEKVWGGQKIKTILGKDYSPLQDCGETWILSPLEGNVSEVSNGPLAGNTLDELVEIFMDDLVGERVYETFQGTFPVLCKFIDANDFLSVQVHPGEELAFSRHGSFGKSEMWYILQADPGAQLINGFNTSLDRDTFTRVVDQGRVRDVLSYVDVNEGDVFDIPAGRVHALGPGILLAEIQQPSDITYRIYDWDRPDKDGKLRELHLDLALDAIDYSPTLQQAVDYERSLNKTVPLLQNPYFTASIIHLDRAVEKDLSGMDAFVVYLCTAGGAKIHYPGGQERLKMGELILVPAVTSEITIIPDKMAKILEIHC